MERPESMWRSSGNSRERPVRGRTTSNCKDPCRSEGVYLLILCICLVIFCNRSQFGTSCTWISFDLFVGGYYWFFCGSLSSLLFEFKKQALHHAILYRMKGDNHNPASWRQHFPRGTKALVKRAKFVINGNAESLERLRRRMYSSSTIFKRCRLLNYGGEFPRRRKCLFTTAEDDGLCYSASI